MAFFSRASTPRAESEVKEVTVEDYVAMAAQIVTLYQHMTAQLTVIAEMQEQVDGLRVGWGEMETRLLGLQDEVNSFKGRLKG